MTTRNVAKNESSVEVIDCEQLLLNFQGMEDVLYDIIQKFLSDSPKMLKRVREAVIKQDSKELEISAHSLKGAVSNFHNEQSFVLARTLEQMGRSRVFTNADGLLENLDTSLSEMSDALNTLARSLK